MRSLTDKIITCPYCSEKNTVLIDATDVDNSYIEDCQVCCQPISFVIQVDDKQEIIVDVLTQNDVI
jgi:transcription elongation factor Elf1